jgi:hypothetical protein
MVYRFTVVTNMKSFCGVSCAFNNLFHPDLLIADRPYQKLTLVVVGVCIFNDKLNVDAKAFYGIIRLHSGGSKYRTA